MESLRVENYKDCNFLLKNAETVLNEKSADLEEQLTVP